MDNSNKSHNVLYDNSQLYKADISNISYNNNDIK